MERADREWLRELAELIAVRERAAPAGGGIDLLGLLAEDPRSGLVELAPGVFTVERHGWGVDS